MIQGMFPYPLKVNSPLKKAYSLLRNKNETRLISILSKPIMIVVVVVVINVV